MLAGTRPGEPAPGDLVWVPGRVHHVGDTTVSVEVGGQLVVVELGAVQHLRCGQPMGVETKSSAQSIAHPGWSA
ncbi:hypothetical protein [Micromonospora haikouensis]|uniref:hypothetical protein n=1 Tax=Micromonospora haikouensis TaxID=686309 RepID=UPI003D710E16